MIASQRYEKILELVDTLGIINIKDMAKTLGVTEVTIRRDCEYLEKQQKLIRVHGGAKSLRAKEIRSSFNDLEMKKRTDHYQEKAAVCQKAASFVQDGECVYLDGGTSIVPMVKYLRGKHVKIVTPSTLIANAFEDGDWELFLVGGKLAPSYNMSVGPLVLEYLTRFNFDHAFIACTGVDVSTGMVYTGEIETMSVKEAAMQQALKSYLLMDTSKLYVKGFYGVKKLPDFDVVLCDQGAASDMEEVPDNFLFV